MNTAKLALISSVALALSACASETETDDAMMADETAMTDEATAPGTIVDVAQEDGQFSTLVEAVTAAGLGDTLSGEGPYTVFAPTNDAFAKLPEGTLETLTTQDTDKLSSILQYHAVEGETDAATLIAAIELAGDAGYEISTVGGGTLNAMMQDGSVVLTDAAGGTSTISATDVDASNGVIHVIDTVLMPE